MKKFMFAMYLVVIMCGSAFAGRQDFKLINYSGRTIVAVYLSPSYQDIYKPEDEFRGGGIPIGSGSSANLHFDSSRNTNVRYWDMRVFFRDGNYWDWSNLDLWVIYQITIDGNGTIHYKTIN